MRTNIPPDVILGGSKVLQLLLELIPRSFGVHEFRGRLIELPVEVENLCLLVSAVPFDAVPLLGQSGRGINNKCMTVFTIVEYLWPIEKLDYNNNNNNNNKINNINNNNNNNNNNNYENYDDNNNKPLMIINIL